MDEEDGLQRIAPQSSVDAALVFDVLHERQRILGKLYPFVVEEHRLRRQKISKRHGRYLSLLAITWAHAVGQRHSPPVERIFENVVLAALGTRLLVGELRVADGFAGTFEGRLRRLAEQLGMTPNHQAAVYRRNANDEGADVIGIFDWQDRCHGRWWAIGQATCAKSEEWQRKLHEPERGSWSRWLTENHPPAVFLAVPHHVQHSVLFRLTQGSHGFVLDRLRLVLCDGFDQAKTKNLIEAMRAGGATVWE